MKTTLNNILYKIINRRNGQIFIDDERYPVKLGSMFIIRNMTQFISYCENNEFPKFITFDHDLGEDEKTGYDIAHWIVNSYLDEALNIKDFSFEVHSQNPVGKKNIETLLNNFLRYKNDER